LKEKKREDEKKEAELQKRVENKKLYEEEMSNIVSKNKKTTDPIKMTKAEIAAQNKRVMLMALAKSAGVSINVDESKKEEGDEDEERKSEEGEPKPYEYQEDFDREVDLEENPNRFEREQDEEDRKVYSEVIRASGINEVLEKLDPKVDKHPENRMKAAFNEYVELQLPVLKNENPGLKRSQLMEIIKKNWKKAPENPFNQAHLDFNDKVTN